MRVPLSPKVHKAGYVPMCWDRIKNAAPQLKIDWHILLLQAVAFHEHSHAARGSRPDKPVEVLCAEETVAQWEAYMYLKSCGEDPCIDAMKKLMERQPPCYHIPVP